MTRNSKKERTLVRQQAMKALGISDFIFQRGMFGFGTTFALVQLMWSLYDGKQVDWDTAKINVAFAVFLGGPLWGLGMWYWLVGRTSPKLN